jgi:hypothetical protein
MKKYTFILVVAFIIGVNIPIRAQQLLDNLMGKWNVKEYHNNQNVAMSTGFIDFQQDGVFESRGTYFGNRKGLYRTDETRSLVLFDHGKTTEWKATLTNNVLRLDRIIKKQKKSTVYILLVKEGKDENQQVIN